MIIMHDVRKSYEALSSILPRLGRIEEYVHRLDESFYQDKKLTMENCSPPYNALERAKRWTNAELPLYDSLNSESSITNCIGQDRWQELQSSMRRCIDEVDVEAPAIEIQKRHIWDSRRNLKEAFLSSSFDMGFRSLFRSSRNTVHEKKRHLIDTPVILHV